MRRLFVIAALVLVVVAGCAPPPQAAPAAPPAAHVPKPDLPAPVVAEVAAKRDPPPQRPSADAVIAALLRRHAIEGFVESSRELTPREDQMLREVEPALADGPEKQRAIATIRAIAGGELVPRPLLGSAAAGTYFWGGTAPGKIRQVVNGTRLRNWRAGLDFRFRFVISERACDAVWERRYISRPANLLPCEFPLPFSILGDENGQDRRGKSANRHHHEQHP